VVSTKNKVLKYSTKRATNINSVYDVMSVTSSEISVQTSKVCNGPVHLFVCLSVCLSPNCKNAIFSKTKQFRAMVSTDDL